MKLGQGIQLRGVSKRFGSHQVLRNIDACWGPGQIHGIVGRNGSGKTVLMKLICGFIPADAGFIEVNGIQITRSTNIPSGIGAIIEAPGFLPHFSGFNNLRFLADIRGKISNEQIRDAMSVVGLDPVLRRHVGSYSLGMRQRLGIAQALMEDPPLLILDEPMNGLDNAGAYEIRKLLKTHRENGKTILLASHNQTDIDELCDSVHEMNAGELLKIR